LDSLLEFINASLVVASKTERIYRFNVGDLDVNQTGAFNVRVRVKCGDSTRLGQTLCLKTQISPDTIAPQPLWSGANVETNVSCNKDSVTFKVVNTGNAGTKPLRTIVLADSSSTYTTNIQLAPNGVYSYKVPSNGKTWRILVDQEPNNPRSLRATSVVEGCRTTPTTPFSTGFVMALSNNVSKNRSIYWECKEIQGSFDPNDKVGLPRGYGKSFTIPQNQDIEYMIRFQNTGTDTAFTVVIRDTISDKLDLSSIEFGASSHKYEAEVYGKSVLKFTFSNINLVDSFKNEPKSHGFIKYRINQRKDLPFGTKILNNAGIYFDFNEPVITNKTLHTIGKEVVSATVEKTFFEGINMKIAPNPFSESCTIEWENSNSYPLSIFNQFELFDLAGKAVRSEHFQGNRFEFNRKGLNSGMYIFNIMNGNQRIGMGKILIQ
jgi:uncharacterized repeat protein (TIGR01451 family)